MLGSQKLPRQKITAKIKVASADERFLDKLRKSIEVREMEEWYSLTVEEMCKHGGRDIVAKYGSPLQFMRSVLPGYDWIPWKFRQVPKGFWANVDNQRQYFDWLGNTLGFKVLEDWYKISREDIVKYQGAHLLTRYQTSPIKALQTIYSQHIWLPWKFARVSTGFWEDIGNQKKFVEWLGKQLNVTSMEGWYRVSLRQIRKWAPTTAFQYNGFGTLLKNTYPGK
jgi:hypothetical protein